MERGDVSILNVGIEMDIIGYILLIVIPNQISIDDEEEEE